ncbi:4-coumarate--CoA ligase [Roseiarcus fermentans]|uniref:4-coumarate--CoA ligase n=1 Tax=Roseiarcus fermentans TaxID=1473586 RepID=A0A366EFK6_9HYPH|nr:feruloyl-CoA synthase [Roseiarcus fermentans]RBP00235.1 4-coumarate--CoA ligase [Roseiarcus fermentans]
MKIPLTFGPPHVTVDKRGDGSMIVMSPEPLAPYPRSMTDWLDHWARAAPDRVFIAERRGGGWRKVTYAEARDLARRIAQGLIDRGLSPERPVAILSGNSVDHALIGLGAMIAGVPYAPVSQPYSLIAKDYGKLKTILDVLTPGLVYVADGDRFTLALAAGVPKATEVVAGINPPKDWPSSTFEALIARPAGPEVDAAHARVGPDTIAKLLFTSGSTGTPKGVINTQKMMTSNQAMLRGVNPSYHVVAPVLLDWLPWSHTFGGNNNFNLVLSGGGSYFIDEGRPLPGAIEATVRNLKEVSPTIYYNVPKGFEMLLPYAEHDADLRKGLFQHLQAFVYAGAALAPHVREAFERLGRETVGHVVPILTSLGSTETGPSALSVTEKACAPGVVGIPNHGVELKLVPNGDKLEARLKSPSITPGYWRRPDLTKDAFDEEGYYKLGDALKFFDERDPELGFVFDGRVAEDFKLATGTWVSVGPLRIRFIAHFGPYVTDLVVAGHDRDDAAALVVPNVSECRALAGLSDDASDADVCLHPKVRDTFSTLLAAFNKKAGGSSGRFARLILMDDPPSLDSGELTDKGSINQRAVLALRADVVEELFDATPSARTIV